MADNDATEALAAAGNSDTGTGVTKQNQVTPASPSTGSVADWVTGLPEPLQAVVKGKGWSQPADVLNSYVSLEKVLGKSVQDMTPEEKARYYKKLGDRPESADGYELSDVKLPDGLGDTPESQRGLKVWMLDQGFTKAQAKAMDERAKQGVLAAVDAAKRAQAALLQGYETAMRKPENWGADYDANIKGIEALVTQLGEADVQKFMKGPGRHPAMLRFLHKVRGTMLEDTLEGGGPVTGTNGSEPTLSYKEALKKAGIDVVGRR